MENIFSLILNMSYVSCFVIIFVIFIRLFLKRFPKIISYGLWSVVAFRLIVPFAIESNFSIIPKNLDTSIVRYEVAQTGEIGNLETVNVSVASSENSSENTSETGTTGLENTSIKSLNNFEIAMYIWTLGIALLVLYSLFSIVKLRNKLKNAKLVVNNIYELENLKTPFVFGIIKPLIYLPKNLDEEEKINIIKHEQIHIKRHDHIIKIFAFILLILHWFNPLVWIAFVLMNNDMELSCDEKVIKELGGDIRKSYATSLVTLATEKHINSCPIAFSEGNVEGRVKNVLNYKKKPVILTVIVSLVVIIVGAMLLFNPMQAKSMAISYQSVDNTGGYGFSVYEESIINYAYEVYNSKEVSNISYVDLDSMEKYGVYFDGDEINNYTYYYDKERDMAFISEEGVYYSVTTDFAEYVNDFATKENIHASNSDANLPLTKENLVLINESSNSDDALFKMGMTSDEVYDVVTNSDVDFTFNVTDEEVYDDKYLITLNQEQSGGASVYKYKISNNLHMFFDKDKKLISMYLAHDIPVGTYEDVTEFYSNNKGAMFYNGLINTDEGLNLLSTVDEIEEKYGEPYEVVSTENEDNYYYKLEDDLYLGIMVIGTPDEVNDTTPLIYRISYYDYMPPLLAV